MSHIASSTIYKSTPAQATFRAMLAPHSHPCCRSLSTLGHVISSLVDLQSGKSRHVPYRDSRLTFLLQARL
jgi:hypothetical protein